TGDDEHVFLLLAGGASIGIHVPDRQHAAAGPVAHLLEPTAIFLGDHPRPVPEGSRTEHPMAAVVGAGRDGIPHLVAGGEAISQDACLIFKRDADGEENAKNAILDAQMDVAGGSVDWSRPARRRTATGCGPAGNGEDPGPGVRRSNRTRPEPAKPCRQRRNRGFWSSAI